MKYYFFYKNKSIISRNLTSESSLSRAIDFADGDESRVFCHCGMPNPYVVFPIINGKVFKDLVIRGSAEMLTYSKMGLFAYKAHLEFRKKRPRVKKYINELKKSGHILEFIKDQNEEMILTAVSQNGMSLEYAKIQNEKICLTAVSQNGESLKFVKNKTKEVCIEAVKQDGRALAFVKDQTEAICLAAVKQNVSSLQYVKNQTVEMCLTALMFNKLYYQYIKIVDNPDYETTVKNLENLKSKQSLKKKISQVF